MGTTDLGDWGKQYGLLALAYEKYGDEEALQADPINHLFHLYVRISSEKETQNEEIKALKADGKDTTQLEADSLDEQARRYFKKMVCIQSWDNSRFEGVECMGANRGQTDRDASALALWERFRDLSIARYKGKCKCLLPHFKGENFDLIQ